MTQVSAGVSQTVAPPNDPSFSEAAQLFRTKKHQVALFNANYWQLVFGTINGMIFVFIVTWGSVPFGILAAWAVLVCLLLVLRSRVYTHQTSTPVTPENIDSFTRTMIVMAGLAGLFWGLGAMVFGFYAEYLTRVFLVLIIGSMCMGSLPTYSAHPPVYLSFSAAACVPVIFQNALGGTQEAWVLSGGLFIVWLLMLSYCRNMNKAYRESIELRFHNEALVEELRDNQAKLEAESQARLRFMASASHDLRQPLHSLGLLHSVAERRLGPGHERLFAQISAARASLLDLFNTLLDSSQLRSGKVKLDKQDMALVPFAEDIATAVPPPSSGAVAFERDFAAVEGVRIHSDPRLLRRIVTNLLSNALKYTERGSVTLRMRGPMAPPEDLALTGPAICISVIDTGPGISTENLARVFDEYEQLGTAQPGKQVGVGLGLSIVQEFSALIGAALQVTSNLNQGSSFTVWVPVGAVAASTRAEVQDHAPATEAQTQDIPQAEENEAPIVILDDDPLIVAATSATLEPLGVPLISGTTVAEVARELGERRPRLLIVDQVIGAEDLGTDLIAYFNSDPDHLVPAIIVSGSELPDDVMSFRGVQDLISKPVDPARLQTAVARALLATPQAQQPYFSDGASIPSQKHS